MTTTHATLSVLGVCLLLVGCDLFSPGNEPPGTEPQYYTSIR